MSKTESKQTDDGAETKTQRLARLAQQASAAKKNGISTPANLKTIATPIAPATTSTNIGSIDPDLIAIRQTASVILPSSSVELNDRPSVDSSSEDPSYDYTDDEFYASYASYAPPPPPRLKPIISQEIKTTSSKSQPPQSTTFASLMSAQSSKQRPSASPSGGQPVNPKSKPNTWVNGEKFIPLDSPESFSKELKPWVDISIPAGSRFTSKEWAQARKADAQNNGVDYLVLEVQDENDASLLKFKQRPADTIRKTYTDKKTMQFTEVRIEPTAAECKGTISPWQSTTLSDCLLLSPKAQTSYTKDVSGIITHSQRWVEQESTTTLDASSAQSASQDGVLDRSYRLIRPRQHRETKPHLYGLRMGFDEALLTTAKIHKEVAYDLQQTDGADWEVDEALDQSYMPRMRS